MPYYYAGPRFPPETPAAPESAPVSFSAEDTASQTALPGYLRSSFGVEQNYRPSFLATSANSRSCGTTRGGGGSPSSRTIRFVPRDGRAGMFPHGRGGGGGGWHGNSDVAAGHGYTGVDGSQLQQQQQEMFVPTGLWPGETGGLPAGGGARTSWSDRMLLAPPCSSTCVHFSPTGMNIRSPVDERTVGSVPTWGRSAEACCARRYHRH